VTLLAGVLLGWLTACLLSGLPRPQTVVIQTQAPLQPSPCTLLILSCVGLVLFLLAGPDGLADHGPVYIGCAFRPHVAHLV
jgi:hypothetical protein